MFCTLLRLLVDFLLALLEVVAAFVLLRRKLIVVFVILVKVYVNGSRIHTTHNLLGRTVLLTTGFLRHLLCRA